MAWLVVNEDGTETVHGKVPYKGLVELASGYSSMWMTHWDGQNFNDLGIILPQGSIKKLTGKELTWENEPIEI